MTSKWRHMETDGVYFGNMDKVDQDLYIGTKYIINRPLL